MRLPREIGPIHFVGIGGIGMSGIAEVLSNLGYTVQGSDASESGNVARLREKGITVSIGHKAENVDGADVVVVSTAIKRDNPELMAARAQRIPVVRRAEMLAELMRLKSCVAIAGTHGKTTTTTMVATLLDAGDLDPTVINGGIINAYGSNARLGAGDWMVVEADESDGTFLKLPTDVVIVTNIDPEHLDHFKTFEAMQDAFRNFVENVPFYGFAVMCIDHPVVQTLVGKIEDRRIITYGENPQADARLVDLTPMGGGSKFKVVFRNRKTDATHEIADIMLPMPGRHNASNATAAIAVAHELGISDEAIRKAIAGFGGVKRRFTRTGEWNGVTVIDDYGHHPVEIAAVLKAARESTNGKIVAVMESEPGTGRIFDAFSLARTGVHTGSSPGQALLENAVGRDERRGVGYLKPWTTHLSFYSPRAAPAVICFPPKRWASNSSSAACGCVWQPTPARCATAACSPGIISTWCRARPCAAAR